MEASSSKGSTRATVSLILGNCHQAIIDSKVSTGCVTAFHFIQRVQFFLHLRCDDTLRLWWHDQTHCPLWWSITPAGIPLTGKSHLFIFQFLFGQVGESIQLLAR